MEGGGGGNACADQSTSADWGDKKMIHPVVGGKKKRNGKGSKPKKNPERSC